jgi:hypothetical protein
LVRRRKQSAPLRSRLQNTDETERLIRMIAAFLRGRDGAQATGTVLPRGPVVEIFLTGLTITIVAAVIGDAGRDRRGVDRPS